jgi:3-oxo-5-alpha-steroid 4-dehydrogenase 1
MELVSPLFFTCALLRSPLSSSPPSLSVNQILLVLLYLLHYANRALFSPLRTPSRSKSHISVPVVGVFFNTINGSLMGTYLSSPASHAFLSNTTPLFYIGLGVWALGFVGNIIHDEILLDIRRKAKSKGKGQARNDDTKQRTPEHYAIPYGLLYRYVSYPNYLCEWFEWFGFALAAAPFPSISASQLSFAAFSWSSVSSFLSAPPSLFAPSLSPPYIFLLSEILLMLPRAYKGHLWYKERFGDRYPKERKVIVPFVL